MSLRATLVFCGVLLEACGGPSSPTGIAQDASDSRVDSSDEAPSTGDAASDVGSEGMLPVDAASNIGGDAKPADGAGDTTDAGASATHDGGCPTAPPFDDSNASLVSACTVPVAVAVGNGLRR